METKQKIGLQVVAKTEEKMNENVKQLPTRSVGGY